jgi:hypothetical protein
MAMSRRSGLVAGLLILSAGSLLASSLAQPMREVERLRGLTFVHDVAQRTIGRGELRSLLGKQLASSVPYSLQEYADILASLQLVDSSSGVIDRMLELYDSQVLAFYDPLTHTYFAIRELPASVAGISGAEALRDSVVIHELVHALQDQRFGAADRDRLLLHDTDGELAYHALLEGEASLVMLDSLIEKSGQSFDEAVKSELLLGAMSAGSAAEGMIDKDVPRYFVESLKFPYIEGLRLVLEGYKRGGWKEIDRMDVNPPRTTREVLHPDEYFARLNRGERGAPPFDPPASGELLTIERLGEFHWRFLVGNAAGWVDDRVTVGCDGIVTVETRWENPQSAASFREAYVSFLRRRGIEPRVSSDGDAVEVVYLP